MSSCMSPTRREDMRPIGSYNKSSFYLDSEHSLTNRTSDHFSKDDCASGPRSGDFVSCLFARQVDDIQGTAHLVGQCDGPMNGLCFHVLWSRLQVPLWSSHSHCTDNASQNGHDKGWEQTANQFLAEEVDDVAILCVDQGNGPNLLAHIEHFDQLRVRQLELGTVTVSRISAASISFVTCPL